MNNQEKPSQQTKDEWHNNPSNWKLGIFYYNKSDPRLFPPKRIWWTGWTVNFANPFSILALIGLILAIFVLMYFFKK
ncbi:MAG: DUF5808 domain-containing protein [Candidatus Kapabacteria bacterium]|nr:DUF5808 domain-containing protein [Candidatus Kapabacteria bacterium]